MKLSGETVVTLVAGVAAGLAVLYAVRQAQAAAEAVSGIPGRLWDSVTGAAVEVADVIAGTAGRAYEGAVATVTETRQAVADANPRNPGYQLPAGWYRVNTRYGEVVTRNPDAFKTINPYDTLGLIDP